MCRVLRRKGEDVWRMTRRIEIGDHIRPFARRGQSDGAAPLAAGEAFNGHQLDAGRLAVLYGFRERLLHLMARPSFPGLQRLLATPAGDADMEGNARPNAIRHRAGSGEGQSANGCNLAQWIGGIEPAKQFQHSEGEHGLAQDQRYIGHREQRPARKGRDLVA